MSILGSVDSLTLIKFLMPWGAGDKGSRYLYSVWPGTQHRKEKWLWGILWSLSTTVMVQLLWFSSGMSHFSPPFPVFPLTRDFGVPLLLRETECGIRRVRPRYSWPSPWRLRMLKWARDYWKCLVLGELCLILWQDGRKIPLCPF